MKFSHANRSVAKGDRNLLVLPLIFSSQFFSNNVNAESSANIGLVSNYIWRGVSQSNDKIALFGGFDINNKSGLYAGSWASSLNDGNYELDLYAGFSKEISGISYDLGIISYQYPRGDDYFNEVYFKLGYSLLQANVSYTFSSKDDNSTEFSQGDVYYSISSNQSFENGFAIGATLGHYDFDNQTGDDYNHFNLNINKNDFTIALDKTSNLTNNNDLAASIAWSKSFDF